MATNNPWRTSKWH